MQLFWILPYQCDIQNFIPYIIFFFFGGGIFFSYLIELLYLYTHLLNVCNIFTFFSIHIIFSRSKSGGQEGCCLLFRYVLVKIQCCRQGQNWRWWKSNSQITIWVSVHQRYISPYHQHTSLRSRLVLWKQPEPKFIVIFGEELKPATAWGVKVSSVMGLPMLLKMSIQRYKVSSHPLPPRSP